MKRLIDDLNLKKQANDLGVKIWQTPGFLFLMIGLVAIIVMTATYFISRNYDRPEILIISECVVVAVILSIGNSFIGIVERMTKLNKMKSEFISVASHQLRTPISGIQWETELLLSKFNKGLSDKQLKNIQMIRSLSERMARLVSDLLDVARIDQGRLVLKKDSVNLAEVTQEVIDEMSVLAKARNIKIIFSFPKKMPVILADKEKIKIVVENLVSNSVKYTVNHGKIEIKISKNNRKLIFTIKDNGVGIPHEQQDRVFERFFRSDNVVKYQTEGTGLGLYIAKNIIEQSGGEIEFKSRERVGTIFNFSLPIK